MANEVKKKTLHVNERLLEKLPYPADHLPIVRLHNRLDDFQNGELTLHWHSEFQFGLLLRGQLVYQVAQTPQQLKPYIIQPGDGFFVNSKVLHSCRQTAPGSEIFTFGVSPSYFASPLFGELYQHTIAPLLHSSTAFSFFPCRDPCNTAILQLFTAFESLGPGDECYELQSVALLCRIWQKFLAFASPQQALTGKQLPGDPHSSRITRMIDFILTHYQEDLTVDDIARAGRVSRRECFRCFRMSIGQTPAEYLIQHRLSVASYLLITTRKPLSEVSECCGFESASYFSKRFKQRYGISPRQFRG